MRKSKYCLLGALCACLTLGVAVGCGDNDDDKKTSENPKEVMLADFEKWAPDFQTIRLRNEFGSVDVNTDSAYVKSGKQSAALTVVGAEGAEKPLFFVNTVSGRFDYDYSDFSKIDSVSAWLYNASQTDETVYVGLITSIVSIEQVGYEKYETFTLKSGWNEVVYKPDMNYVISAVGQEEYDGIKGVYFMFDNPHAATKAKGKKFYVDDIKLNYGEEKPYSEVRAGKYYTSGTQIGAPSYITLKNPVTMKELEDKALSFEFKFDTDTGRFGFAIMCDDYNWNNITGTLVIEKTADGVVANMGRIETLEDGWYVWKLNQEFFAGDGAGRAESVSLIYHQGEVVQGNVIINWNSMKAVDAYEVTKEEKASRYVTGDEINGNYNGKPTLFDPIDIAEFENKALRFEFKFISETGKFGFVFLDNPTWANITGTLTVEKKADGTYEANMGKIKELENGWYAWELNREFFAGDGVQNAQNVGLIYCQDEKVTGEVLIDWSSVQAVDAYVVTREERASRYVTGDGINGNFSGQPVLFDPIDIAEFESKALHVEFKFVSATGKFRFAIQANNNPDWKNITGLIEIEKHDDGTITSNIGRVIKAQEDGWYAWEINKDMCAGDGALDAMNVTIICDGEMTAGEALIDWNSLSAVDPYSVSKEERATRYVANDLINGNFGGQPTLFNPIDIAEFANKALYFEFKFVSATGKFGFVFMDSPDWANITGTVTVEKKADGTYEANMGKIVEVADGWYAWKLNSDLFKGDGAANAKNVGLVNDGSEKVVGEVLIDWKSVQAVDEYVLTREELSSKYVAGSEVNGNYNGQPTIFEPISLEALNGKALSFEFKFESATGKFAFEFQGDTSVWNSITGKVTVEKTASGITASIGKIVDKGEGWYAWKLNSSLFAGGGLSSATSVDFVSGAGKTEGTAYIDWRTLKADDAYELTKEERAFRYVAENQINGNFNGQPTIFDPIDIARFTDKALYFEFKFVSETGKFGFVFMDSPDWKNITGTLTVEKKSDGTYVANKGIIVEVADGWYAWKLNSSLFAGDGAGEAKNVGLVNDGGEKVVGEVLIDWKSVQAVDAYTFFASKSNISWEILNNGNAAFSVADGADGDYNALKISNSPTSQWTIIALTIDPEMQAQLSTAEKLSLKLKIQRNTAAENLTFNFRIATWKEADTADGQHDVWAKISDDAVDGYSDNVPVDAWHTIDFFTAAPWGDSLTPLTTNGGKIYIQIEVANASDGDDFGYDILIDDISVISSAE